MVVVFTNPYHFNPLYGSQPCLVAKGLVQRNKAMSHAMQGQDGQVTVESSDKMWSAGRENGKPCQYSCGKNPMNSLKRQKDITSEDKPPRSEGVQYAPGEEGRAINNTNSSERMKQLGQSRNPGCKEPAHWERPWCWERFRAGERGDRG